VGKCNVRYKQTNKQTNKYVLFIDDVVKDVNNVFYEAANLSLKQKPLRKSTSKPKQNVKKKPKWLDVHLSKLKSLLTDKEKYSTRSI
jgi:hypothetical protein